MMADSIRIAFGSEPDGETLSSRFGMAPNVVVVMVRDGMVVNRERRDKVYNKEHHHHADEDDHDHGAPDDKFAAIADCQVLITRSIGPHGADYAASQDITLYTVREKTISAALDQYLAGTLEHDPRRVV